MSLTGAKVSHARFGSDAIAKMENGYISVRFEGMAETKKFVYPDAFRAFLWLTNAAHEETLQARRWWKNAGRKRKNWRSGRTGS